MGPFVPSRAYAFREQGAEQRIRHLEEMLVRLADGVGVQSQQIAGVGNPQPVAGGPIPEDQVQFFTVGGHDHDGNTATLIPITGDVTGDNSAAVVAQIQAVPVAVPAGGDDGQFARYNSSGPTISWETPTGTGSNYSVIGGWGRQHTTGASGTKTIVPYSVPGFSFNGGIIFGRAGTLSGISASLEGSIGGAGKNFEVEIYLNGVATGLLATNTGGSGTDQFAHGEGSVAFTATDQIAVYDQKTGAINDVGVAVILNVKFS